MHQEGRVTDTPVTVIVCACVCLCVSVHMLAARDGRLGRPSNCGPGAQECSIGSSQQRLLFPSHSK